MSLLSNRTLLGFTNDAGVTHSQFLRPFFLQSIMHVCCMSCIETSMRSGSSLMRESALVRVCSFVVVRCSCRLLFKLQASVMPAVALRGTISVNSGINIQAQRDTLDKYRLNLNVRPTRHINLCKPTLWRPTITYMPRTFRVPRDACLYACLCKHPHTCRIQ